MKDSLDIIRLRGLSAVGHHGVYDFERNGSQVFSADLALYVDASEAARTDDVNKTVDYSHVAEDAVAVLTGAPVYLLETLAQRLADVALENPLVQAVEVTVHKPMAPVRHQFSDVSVTLRRDRRDQPSVSSKKVVLALGSNLGDSTKHLIGALEALIGIPGFEVDDVSSLYRTKPVLAPGASPQDDYMNAVVVGRTVLTPRELLHATQAIEAEFGRTRDERWAPRTLDIDIVDFGGLRIESPELTVPHPRAAQRAFVLIPWAEVDSETTLSDGRTIQAAIEQAEDRDGVTFVATEWFLEEPQNTQESESTAKVEADEPRSDPAPADGDGDRFYRMLRHRAPDAEPRPHEPEPAVDDTVTQTPLPAVNPQRRVRIIDAEDEPRAQAPASPSEYLRPAVLRPTPTGTISIRRGAGTP